MKYFILAMLCVLELTRLQAQHQIVGVINNPENEPLIGATVVLLDQDSTMVSFSLTNNQGEYLLDEIAKGEYILQVSYISYANYSVQIAPDWTLKKIDLGLVVLEESTEVLTEVTIKAEHIPMGLRGDTLSYNASAFKTRPNATVEDLLKKLPGVEVDRNGNIKAQGEDVNNVLVDGKEFFGSDPKMATKNLVAEAVDKVEVYDKKSDIAEFTGVDDGQEEKTINLKLKEDHKKGGFGNANVAGGTQDAYDSKLNYFRFTPKLQASMIFAANNINKETFTINDRIDFMGGMMNAMSGGVLNLNGAMGPQDGINSSLSAGANFNYDFSPKVQMLSHYVLNRTGNQLLKQSNVQSFTDAFNYSNSDVLDADYLNLNHQINTKFNYKVNPLLELVFRNNMNWQDEFTSRSLNSQYKKDGIDSGFARSFFSSDSDDWTYESSTLIKKKFTKKGRNVISSVNFQRTNDRAFDDVNNINRISENSFDLVQNQDFNNNQLRTTLSSNYTEPLSKKYFLGLNYKYGLNFEKPNRDYFDISDNSRFFNMDLSSEFEKLYQYNLAGVNIKRNTSKVKISIGLQGQLTQLKGNINNGEQEISGTFRNLLPSAFIEYDIKGGSSMSGNYTTNITAPRIDQLMPLPNNTNPNYEYLGNPNLIPAYNQRINLSYNYYDNFSFTSLWARLNLTKTSNRIVTKSTIDNNLFRTIEPINVDNYISFGSHFNFSRPLKPLKINYKIRLRSQIAYYDSFINDQLSEVTDNNYNIKASFSNRKTKFFSLESGISLDFFTKKYGINPDFNQNYNNTDLFVEAEFYLPKAWVISSDFNFIKFSNETFSDETAFSVWSATVSKYFLDNKLEFRISAFDILNQNIGFRRSGGTNSIREESFNNLSQYFLLGVHYKIGKGTKKGIQIDFD